MIDLIIFLWPYLIEKHILFEFTLCDNEPAVLSNSHTADNQPQSLFVALKDKMLKDKLSWNEIFCVHTEIFLNLGIKFTGSNHLSKGGNTLGTIFYCKKILLLLRTLLFMPRRLKIVHLFKCRPKAYTNGD